MKITAPAEMRARLVLRYNWRDGWWTNAGNPVIDLRIRVSDDGARMFWYTDHLDRVYVPYHPSSFRHV